MTLKIHRPGSPKTTGLPNDAAVSRRLLVSPIGALFSATEIAIWALFSAPGRPKFPASAGGTKSAIRSVSRVWIPAGEVVPTTNSPTAGTTSAECLSERDNHLIFSVSRLSYSISAGSVHPSGETSAATISWPEMQPESTPAKPKTQPQNNTKSVTRKAPKTAVRTLRGIAHVPAAEILFFIIVLWPRRTISAIPISVVSVLPATIFAVSAVFAAIFAVTTSPIFSSAILAAVFAIAPLTAVIFAPSAKIPFAGAGIALIPLASTIFATISPATPAITAVSTTTPAIPTAAFGFVETGDALLADHVDECRLFFDGTHGSKPGDRIRIGDLLTYRAEKNGLRYDPASDGLRLVLRGVTVAREGKTIFRNLSTDIECNEFVGIIGPSGCGKSTLLEILSLAGGEFDGAIFFDGDNDLRDMNVRRQCKTLFGYVPQDDVVYPKLTVEENLRFAARLCFDGDAARVEEAIEESLDRVGLKGHRNKMVQKISGGQRKRVSIAMELLKRPRLLILDEPTSGLDPKAESNIMRQLQMIARQGTTVLCTTHMMANVENFDKIIAFETGGVRAYSRRGGVSAIQRLKGDKTFAELYENLGVCEPDEMIPETPEWSRNMLAFLQPLDRPIGKHGRRIKDVVHRCWINFRQDPMSVLMTLGQPIVLGSLAVLSQYDELDVLPLLFFCIVIAVWLGMNNSVRSLVGERRHYVRENLSGLSMFEYLAGKTLFYSMMGALQLAVLLAVVHFLPPQLCLSGLYETDFPKIMPGTFFGVLLLCYVCSLGLGLFVSTVASTENAALTFLPLLIMPQILLSMIAAGNYGDLRNDTDSRRIRTVAEMFPSKKSDVVFKEAESNERKSDIPFRTFERLSLLCYTRPALFIFEAKIDDKPSVLQGELSHLAGLGGVTWLALGFAFYRRQEHWRRRH